MLPPFVPELLARSVQPVGVVGEMVDCKLELRSARSVLPAVFVPPPVQFAVTVFVSFADPLPTFPIAIVILNSAQLPAAQDARDRSACRLEGLWAADSPALPQPRAPSPDFPERQADI